MKVQIFSVNADDQAALTQVQQKLNIWLTTGLLKKYEIHTTSNQVVFNILLNKETKGE
jgi:hypothetical protein